MKTEQRRRQLASKLKLVFKDIYEGDVYKDPAMDFVEMCFHEISHAVVFGMTFDEDLREHLSRTITVKYRKMRNRMKSDDTELDTLAVQLVAMRLVGVPPRNDFEEAIIGNAASVMHERPSYLHLLNDVRTRMKLKVNMDRATQVAAVIAKVDAIDKLTKAEVLCLRRTKVVSGIGNREIDPSELGPFMGGPNLQDRTWNSLKRRGYVANGRGISCRLTAKGEKALNALDFR